MSDVSENLGTRSIRPLSEARFPDMGRTLSRLPTEARPPGTVDVLLVNPPAPDWGIWIRSQHQVGRRSREGMIWPQVSLAQLAAMLHSDCSVEIVDAIPRVAEGIRKRVHKGTRNDQIVRALGWSWQALGWMR